MSGYSFAAGTSGGMLLSEPIGARASGMGEAYTAVTGDIYGVYYNPALVTGFESRQAAFFWNNGIDDDGIGFLGFGYPGKNIAIAGTLVYHTAGTIELIDSSGNSRSANAQEEHLLGLSLGRRINNIAIGINLKLFKSVLVDKFVATAYAFDVGFLSKFSDRFSAGVSLQNYFGNEIKYSEIGDPLPKTIRVGFAYNLFGQMALDIVKPHDSGIEKNIGFELFPSKTVVLRIGYKFNDDRNSLSYGAGLDFGTLLIDYSTVLMDDLGATQKMSLTMKFGGVESSHNDSNPQKKSKKKRVETEKEKTNNGYWLYKKEDEMN